MLNIKSYLVKIVSILTIVMTIGSVGVSYANSKESEEFDGFVKLDYSTEELNKMSYGEVYDHYLEKLPKESKSIISKEEKEALYDIPYNSEKSPRWTGSSKLIAKGSLLEYSATTKNVSPAQRITHVMSIKDNAGTEWMKVEEAKNGSTGFTSKGTKGAPRGKNYQLKTLHSVPNSLTIKATSTSAWVGL